MTLYTLGRLRPSIRLHVDIGSENNSMMPLKAEIQTVDVSNCVIVICM